MSTFREDVTGAALDLAYGLWAELGLDGVPRRHDWQALDLEPLLIFTACCVVAGSRLRAKTIDWCIANTRYISTIRLSNLSRMAGPASRRAVRRYVGEIEKGSPAAVNASPDLRRPSLIQLRLRALVGVSARAEVLRLLLASTEQPLAAASIEAAAGFGRDDLAQALDAFTAAGITIREPSADRFVYRLSRPAELAESVGGVPAAFPDWPAVFNITLSILKYARERAAEPAESVEAAAGLQQAMGGELETVSGAGLPPRISGAVSVLALEQWARSFVIDQAAAGVTRTQTREVTYTVHRLLLGGWIATVKEVGGQPRPLALSDAPELRPERRAQRRLNLDEVGAAADVIESMLLDMRTRDLERSHGSLVPRHSVSDSMLPAMSREFATEMLQPMHKGQAATFTEEFLRRWSESRRQGFSEAG